MISHDELSRALASMVVDWPDEVDVRPRVLRQIQAPPLQVARRRQLALAAVALLVLTTFVVLLAPGPRAAVARLLGFPGITVERTNEPQHTNEPQRPNEPLPELTDIDLGTPTTLAEVERRFDVLTLPLAERGVFLDEPSGAVHIAYRLPDGTPALLTQLPGGDAPYLAKQAPRVVPTEVGGAFALWVTGREHAVITAGPVRNQARLSDNALLWSADGVTYRLEADVSVDAAVDLAESLR